MPDGRYTREEILSQPESWAAGLRRLKAQRQELLSFWRRERYTQVFLTGCGSTYYLALAAAPLAQEMWRLPCRAFPASELWLHPSACYAHGRTLLIALSRSGETTETLRACQDFLAAARGDLLVLTCDPDSSLAALGTLVLAFPEAQERSVVQTRSFSTLYLATLGLSALWAAQEPLLEAMEALPVLCRDLLPGYASLATQIARGGGAERFFWLGSGPRYGLACELSLKMKEMALSPSEAFHFLEFRHGPKSVVAPGVLVVGLCSSAHASYEQAVLQEVKALGGSALALGEDVRIGPAPGVPEAVRSVLYLPLGQLLALEHALFKGLDPDAPSHLEPVVRLR
ncbi:MAG: SIS domain-containing protein [Chloroflexia bacterium]